MSDEDRDATVRLNRGQVPVMPPKPAADRRRLAGPVFAGVLALAAVVVAAAFAFRGHETVPPAPVRSAAILPAPAPAPPPDVQSPTTRGAAPAPEAPAATLREPETIRPASEEQVLASQSATLSLFRFAPNPRIVVLDFPTMHEQARMLLRVAAFVEIDGMPHDRLVGDDELALAIRERGSEPDSFYYGHDYRAADLARFFAAADRTGTTLDPSEERLRNIVAQEGWLGPDATGALISIPTRNAGGDDAVRATILRHELSHGEYFTNPVYASFARSFFGAVLTERERAAFTRFLAGEDYDAGNSDLMVNETQAYLMHTRNARFFRAESVDMSPERLATLRERFYAGMPAGWLKDRTRP